MSLFGKSRRVIFQCDGGGGEDTSDEEEVSVEEEEEEDTDETSEDDTEEDEEDEEVETEGKNVQRRSTRQSNPNLKPSVGGSKGRMTRQQAREQMPAKRLLRSRNKSPAAGSGARGQNTPPIIQCRKCKKKFGTKQALSLHTHWCQNQSLKKEETNKSDMKLPTRRKSDKEKESEPVVEVPRRGRGRPRNPNKNPPTLSTPSSTKRSQKVEHANNFKDEQQEMDFSRQRSPASSTGPMDTSSESEYEQREFAANAHQLIQNRAHSLSIDVVNADPEQEEIPQTDEFMESTAEPQMIPTEGPVTCPQCKMTYRTLQGFQNHWGSCMAYSSDTDDEEEVDVVHEDSANNEEAQPSLISQSMASSPNVGGSALAAENVAEMQDEETSMSTTSSSEENEIPVEVSATDLQDQTSTIDPAVNSTFPSTSRDQGSEVMNDKDNKKCNVRNVSLCKTTPHLISPPQNNSKSIPATPDKKATSCVPNSFFQPITYQPPLLQSLSAQSDELALSNRAEATSTTQLPDPPNLHLQVSNRLVPNYITQVPTQLQTTNQCTPAAPLQFPLPPPQQQQSIPGPQINAFPRNGPPNSNMITPFNTTTPVLQTSNNTPTYTQAQLMPGTVVHNSVMQAPHQMASSAESSYNSSAPSAPTSLSLPQPIPTVVYDPVTQQHVLRFPNNVLPPIPPQQQINNGYQNINQQLQQFHPQQNVQIPQGFRNLVADQRVQQQNLANHPQQHQIASQPPPPTQQLFPPGVSSQNQFIAGQNPNPNPSGLPSVASGPQYFPHNQFQNIPAQAAYTIPNLPQSQNTPGTLPNNLMQHNVQQQLQMHQQQHLDPNSSTQFPNSNGPQYSYQCLPNQNPASFSKPQDNMNHMNVQHQSGNPVPNMLNANQTLTNCSGQASQYFPNPNQIQNVPYQLQQQCRPPQIPSLSSEPHSQNLMQNSVITPQHNSSIQQNDATNAQGFQLPPTSLNPNNGNPESSAIFPATNPYQNIPNSINQQQNLLNLQQRQQVFGVQTLAPQLTPHQLDHQQKDLRNPPLQILNPAGAPQPGVNINPSILSNQPFQWNKINSSPLPSNQQQHQPQQQQQTCTSSEPEPQAQTQNSTPSQPQNSNPSQPVAQVIQQIAQYTDASGNTNTVIIVTPAAQQQSNNTLNTLGPGVLNLLPGLQNIATQQPQQLQQAQLQTSNCLLNLNNGLPTQSLCTSGNHVGQGRSGPCPCPNCKEKTNASTSMEKYKKVLPYPSSLTSPNSDVNQKVSPTLRPIQIRPAGSKQKTIRIQKTGMLLQAQSSPQTMILPQSQNQLQPGSPSRLLPLGIKAVPHSPTPSSLGQLQPVGGVGVVLENNLSGNNRGNTPLPCSNVAVVRPMENPLQKLTDQISQMESSFMTPTAHQIPLPQQQQLVQQQQHGQGSPTPASIAPQSYQLPQGPHLTLVTASPPPSQTSPAVLQAEIASSSQFINQQESPLVTNNLGHPVTHVKTVEGQPKLMLVDHGSPARLSSPNRSLTPGSAPHTPIRTAAMTGIKRKVPGDAVESVNKSIKVTLRRKEGDDSYSIKGISGSTKSGSGGTMKSLKIKGQIKSGEQAGTSTDVVVVPRIHLVPIPDPDAGETEGNRTIAEDITGESIAKNESKVEDSDVPSTTVQVSVSETSNGTSDGEQILKMTHKAVVVYEVQGNETVLFRSGDVRAVWGYIFETVQGTRLNHNLPPLFYPATNISLPQPNGQPDAADGIFNKLGLTHRAVQFLLEQLPGLKALTSSEFKYTKPPATPSTSSEEEDPVQENESGCARTERFIGRKQFDMFGWLASKHRKKLTFSNVPMETPKNLAAPIPMRFRKLKEKSDKSLMVWCSTIHGRGLFTRRKIEKGEMVIEYAGELIRPMVCDIREKYYQSKSVGCYMFKIDNDKVIDATMNGNAARFINHSCEPNCQARAVKISGKDHIIIFALRQIQCGEELTYDYKFEKEDEKIPCTCGTKHCRKYLN